MDKNKVAEEIAKRENLSQGEVLLLKRSLSYIPYIFLGVCEVSRWNDICSISFYSENRQYKCLIDIGENIIAGNGIEETRDYYNVRYYKNDLYISNLKVERSPHKLDFFEEEFEYERKDRIEFSLERQWVHDCEKMLALVNIRGLNILKKYHHKEVSQKSYIDDTVKTLMSLAHALLGRENLNELRVALDKIESGVE